VTEIAREHGAEIVWEDEVAPGRISGRGRVRAVDETAADLFVAAVAQPALELAAQAGARLVLADDGLPLVVARDRPEWLELRGGAAAASSAVPPVTVAPTAFICLCEDVRARDVRRAIADGFDGPELVKRRTGAMTGPCQGKLCAPAVLGLLREAGKEHEPTTSRPPGRSLTLAELAARA
jgi:bacterioferritin-associated ferredoxin